MKAHGPHDTKTLLWVVVFSMGATWLHVLCTLLALAVGWFLRLYGADAGLDEVGAVGEALGWFHDTILAFPLHALALGRGLGAVGLNSLAWGTGGLCAALWNIRKEAQDRNPPHASSATLGA